MDPFEEFEFKPLTEGLGFHKKADTLKNEVKSTIAKTATSVATSAAMNSEPPRSSIFPKPEPKTERTTERAPTKSFGASAGGLAAASFGTNLTETERTQPEAARSAVEASRTASQSISELMASLPPSLDFLDDKQDLTRKSEMPFGATPMAAPIAPIASSNRPQIFQPLVSPRETSTIATGPTVGSVLPAPGTKAGSAQAAAGVAAPIGAPAMVGGGATTARTGYRERMFESFGKTVPKTEAAETTATEGTLVPVAVNFSAALIDAMVVAGISTILLVCIITITHINLVAMLSNASTDTATQKNLVFLFLAVLQMYMLVSRAFFGSSLGEWAFETQLGTDEQQRQLYYPALVLWRSLFITFTGLLPLPLLSFAFKRDLGKYVSGLQLLRRT